MKQVVKHKHRLVARLKSRKVQLSRSCHNSNRYCLISQKVSRSKRWQVKAMDARSSVITPRFLMDLDDNNNDKLSLMAKV